MSALKTAAFLLIHFDIQQAGLGPSLIETKVGASAKPGINSSQCNRKDKVMLL